MAARSGWSPPWTRWWPRLRAPGRAGDRVVVVQRYQRSWDGDLLDALAASRGRPAPGRQHRRAAPGRPRSRDRREGGRTHASQGEQRCLALALRLGVHELIRARTALIPTLLLDDVFSELDPARSRALVAELPPGQSILTTAAPLPEGIEVARLLPVQSLEAPMTKWRRVTAVHGEWASPCPVCWAGWDRPRPRRSWRPCSPAGRSWSAPSWGAPAATTCRRARARGGGGTPGLGDPSPHGVGPDPGPSQGVGGDLHRPPGGRRRARLSDTCVAVARPFRGAELERMSGRMVCSH